MKLARIGTEPAQMKKNWFGLGNWDRTSPNGHFLIKLQELGQNEKKEGAKLRVPRQTEAAPRVKEA